MQDCIVQHKAFFKFGCIDRFFRWFLMDQFQVVPQNILLRIYW